jgi:ATP-dependent helicase HrpA
MGTPIAELRPRLADLMLKDQLRLGRRLDGARKMRDRRAADRLAEELAREVSAAEDRVASRRAALPRVSYPEQLPVSQRKDDILAAIRDHQVVVVAGETGSGKTTQLPKICLELGRGVLGTIGHTQPRRIAARTVAERIAEELGTEIGATVGYQVRFTTHASDTSLVKVMTDGILLAEIQNDRLLSRYDTLIIDEAHERSLNIDFLLGYLKQLLPRRPDLKVVITSATIDPERFATHFADAQGRPAPIIEVSGRTYPVEVRYRPVVDPDDPESDPDREQTAAIADAVEELTAEGRGDILVFLSGEREIRETADALARLNLRDTEVLPLYARLSAADQHKVFAPHRLRRIVLATNVAETSLTVPGIRYVIDPGFARISRYSNRLKVQRLPIEEISQASANQRKGRCGRLSDGICIRLYTEDDFTGRPEFTDPEILRTNLASVILQMTAAGLGEMADFPFLDPPDKRAVKDGVDLLHELGALDRAGALTKLGRQLAALPLDPRLGRMVLAAQDNGCLHEVLVITAALSIQDPRERPAEHQQAATQQHARFADQESDFFAYLNLWRYLQDQQKALSSNQFRRMCRSEFLHYLRVREWQDLYQQLRQVAKSLGFTITVREDLPDARSLHSALLTGLLSHLGLRDPETQDYLGARGGRFALFPGSALFRKPPRWVVAAELVETSRLWGRINAKVEPEWVEPLAGHLVKRSYSEPHWEARQAAVVASEKVTLYGLPIVAARKVNFGRIDPALSRELFIRHALVEGDWKTHHRFFHDNRALLDEVEELEHRARRRDILVDDETLFAFYDQRIPADVVSGRHFDSWWKQARRATPELLSYTASLVTNPAARRVSEADYPSTWRQGDLELPLTYQFEPGTAADGVTVHVPVAVLGQLAADGFEWQIPGLREDLVMALIRGLPKGVRRNFVPVPDTAAAVLPALDPADGPLTPALGRELRRYAGEVVPPDAWDWSKVPDHLRMTFRVVDESGAVLGEGKDLAALKDQFQVKAREVLTAAAPSVERSGLTAFPAELPREVRREHAGIPVTAYPALVDEGQTVGVRLFETPAAAARAMVAGTRRLLLLTLPSPVKHASGQLSNAAKLALMRNPHGGLPALMDDAVAASVDALVAANGGPAWDAAGFATLAGKVRVGLPTTTLSVLRAVHQILVIAAGLQSRLAALRDPALLPSLTDAREQLTALVGPGFISATGVSHLGDLPRYLQGIERRVEKLPDNPARDRQLMVGVHQVEEEYAALRRELPPSPELAEIRWMIQELRVSLFAQMLGTAYPISDKRIYRAMDELPG